MTTETETVIAGPFTGTGGSQVHAFAFPIEAEGEIAVYEVISGDATLIDPANYTVSGFSPGPGGNVTYTGTSGASIYILSDPSFLQNIDFAANAAFNADSHNEANDRAARRALILKHYRERSVRVPFYEDALLEIAPVSERAAKLFAFDVAGQYTPGTATYGADIETASSIAALNALTGMADGDAVSLQQPGRAGLFVFDDSDLSAEVAADTASAVYATSGDGSGGAWVRQFDHFEIGWFDAVGDNVTDDTAAFAAASSVLALYDGGVIELGKNKTYLIDNWDLSGVSNVAVRANGSAFTDRGGGTSSTSFVDFGPGVELDHLEYTLPTTKTRRRVAELAGAASKLHSFNITSVDQIANTTAGLGVGDGGEDDSAVMMTGANTTIGVGTVTMFDNPYRYAGDNLKIGDARAVSYLRGHWFDVTQGAEIDCLHAETKSVNASATAGHNGVLFTDADDIHVKRIYVANAGEHGVRFGGGIEGSKNITIGHARVRKVGGCGLKIRSGDFTWRNANIHFDSAIISDCGDQDGTGIYTSNEEGILIERADDISFGFVHIFKEDQTQSCARGILVNSSTNISVVGGLIEDVDDQAVYIENSDDGGTTFRDVSNIWIRASILSPVSHAFYMVYSNATFRNINVDIKARNVGGDGFHIANSGGSLAAYCHLNGNFGTLTGAPVAGTATTGGNGFLCIDYTNNGVPTFYRVGTSSSGIADELYSNSGGSATRHFIRRSDGDLENTNNSYGAISDRRIKDNIVDAGPQWDDVKAMKLRAFDNRLAGKRHLGLISDELTDVAPGMVREMSEDEGRKMLRSAHPDASEKDIEAMLSTGPVQSVVYSLLPLKLLGVVQELQARIEALES